jgi:hypothetical protein
MLTRRRLVPTMHAYMSTDQQAGEGAHKADPEAITTKQPDSSSTRRKATQSVTHWLLPHVCAALVTWSAVPVHA